MGGLLRQYGEVHGQEVDLGLGQGRAEFGVGPAGHAAGALHGRRMVGQLGGDLLVREELLDQGRRPGSRVSAIIRWLVSIRRSPR